MGTNISCPNCGENFGKDTENPKHMHCSRCGERFYNPYGYEKTKKVTKLKNPVFELEKSVPYFEFTYASEGTKENIRLKEWSATPGYNSIAIMRQSVEKERKVGVCSEKEVKKIMKDNKQRYGQFYYFIMLEISQPYRRTYELFIYKRYEKGGKFSTLKSALKAVQYIKKHWVQIVTSNESYLDTY